MTSSSDSDGIYVEVLREKSGLDVNDIDFLFDGKTLEEYYPEDLAVPPKTKEKLTHTSALVSASHGYISLHPSREWKFQRPAPTRHSGRHVSPLFGDELQVLMEQRSGLTVHRARSRSTELHPESGKPWEHMSSRYHLKALFPNAPTCGMSFRTAQSLLAKRKRTYGLGQTMQTIWVWM